MAPFLPLLIALPCIVFWFWMFNDLLKNDYLPERTTAPQSWPPTTKSGWMTAFLLLNIFAALWYYLVEYRNRNI